MAADKFMSELHLQWLRFSYSSCKPFTAHREIVSKFREADNLKYLYRSEVDEALVGHDTGYSDRKVWKEQKKIVKLVENVNMIDIKKHWQVFPTIFVIKKQNQELL